MCETLQLPGGGVAILCGGRHRKPPRCRWCANASTRLCDHRNAGNCGTCDAPLCDAHALRTGPNRDLCPPHAKGVAQQQPLFAPKGDAA